MESWVLVGWDEISYELEKYIEKRVQERYFLVGEREDGFTVFPPCTVWPELRPKDVDEGLLRFACYVAVCHTVYGQSFESLRTERILGLVSQLRPDMVKELKTNGSGKLPPDLQKRKTKHLTASANDIFATILATIRITARDSTEGCCDRTGDLRPLYLSWPLNRWSTPRPRRWRQWQLAPRPSTGWALSKRRNGTRFTWPCAVSWTLCRTARSQKRPCWSSSNSCGIFEEVPENRKKRERIVKLLRSLKEK